MPRTGAVPAAGWAAPSGGPRLADTVAPGAEASVQRPRPGRKGSPLCVLGQGLESRWPGLCDLKPEQCVKLPSAFLAALEGSQHSLLGTGVWVLLGRCEPLGCAGVQAPGGTGVSRASASCPIPGGGKDPAPGRFPGAAWLQSATAPGGSPSEVGPQSLGLWGGVGARQGFQGPGQGERGLRAPLCSGSCPCQTGAERVPSGGIQLPEVPQVVRLASGEGPRTQ